MSTVAILIATSRTATEIIAQTLIPSHPNGEAPVVNAIVRNRTKFRSLHPESVLQNENLHIFDYEDKDPASLTPALRNVSTVYITTGGTEFDSPSSVIHDAVSNVTACLLTMRLNSNTPWKKPKIILLSSGGLNPRFQRESIMARLIRRVMHNVNSHFFDLELSEQLLVSFAQTGCYDYILFQPGLIVTAEATGDWGLRDCAYDGWISYADMAASMIYLAKSTEWDGRIAAPVSLTKPRPGILGLNTQWAALGWGLKTFMIWPLIKLVIFGAIGFSVGYWVCENQK